MRWTGPPTHSQASGTSAVTERCKDRRTEVLPIRLSVAVTVISLVLLLRAFPPACWSGCLFSMSVPLHGRDRRFSTMLAYLVARVRFCRLADLYPLRFAVLAVLASAWSRPKALNAVELCLSARWSGCLVSRSVPLHGRDQRFSTLLSCTFVPCEMFCRLVYSRACVS